MAFPTTTKASILCSEIHHWVYSSLMDFYRPLGNNNNNRSIFRWGFLKDDILASCVETWVISYYRVIIISWKILVSFTGFFWKLGFCMVKYLKFHNSSSFSRSQCDNTRRNLVLLQLCHVFWRNFFGRIRTRIYKAQFMD